MVSVYSVSQINNYIKNMIGQDFLLENLQVSGEVSNCKYHNSGHIYFTLKDEKSSISCVMFAGSRSGLTFSMKNGDKITAAGRVDVYEKAGTYQIYVKKIRLSGSGELYEKFLELKNRLEEMGMFAPEYKKPIPKHIRRIGVVTAPAGAAIRDITSIIRRRNPGIQVILFPASVQGEAAKESIVRGLKVLDKAGVDVIIAGRGGGSIEDLWAFNEEVVARAIFECETPVISAVGHETDVTISDYVADLRAPTPSAAAELASENIFDTIERLNAFEKKLDLLMNRFMSFSKESLRRYYTLVRAHRPSEMIRGYRERLGSYSSKLSYLAYAALFDRQYRLKLLSEKLDMLSPLKKLETGFAYVSDSFGNNLKSVLHVKKGDSINIRLKDGEIKAIVSETELILSKEE